MEADDSTAAALRSRIESANQSLRHDLVELAVVSDLGIGWHASADIPAGTELWSEKPFSRHRNRSALVCLVDSDIERHALFCHDAKCESLAEGLVKSNYFELGALGAMLFLRTSFCNHSCCPNATVRIEISPFGACKARLIVARDVKRGEQLCICYSNAACFQSNAARQATLSSRWGFHCRCARCEGTLPLDLANLWVTLEEAAAAADAVKPRSKHVDPAVCDQQRHAAELVARHLPSLAEAERFADDLAYLS